MVTYSTLKFPNFEKRFLLFKQNRQYALHLQHLAFAFLESFLAVSRRDGTVGFSSFLMQFFPFSVLILDETQFKSSLDGALLGRHPPSLEEDISLSNLTCICELAVRMSCPKKALTPSKTGFPRTLWVDLSPDWLANVNIATSSKSRICFGKRLLLDGEDDFAILRKQQSKAAGHWAE